MKEIIAIQKASLERTSHAMEPNPRATSQALDGLLKAHLASTASLSGGLRAAGEKTAIKLRSAVDPPIGKSPRFLGKGISLGIPGLQDVEKSFRIVGAVHPPT